MIPNNSKEIYYGYSLTYPSNKAGPSIRPLNHPYQSKSHNGYHFISVNRQALEMPRDTKKI